MLGISGYILANYGMKKHYITTADIYIESTDDVPSAEKAATAALLFTSPKMYDAVNDNLRTRFSYVELGEIISVEQNNGTQIITAKFDCQTSSESYSLAEMYISLMQRVLNEYDAKATATVIKSPMEPQRPEFPDERLFTIIGAAAGFVISAFGIFIIWRLDKTITSADNIAEQYNVPVIGELVDMDNEIDYLGR